MMLRKKSAQAPVGGVGEGESIVCTEEGEAGKELLLSAVGRGWKSNDRDSREFGRGAWACGLQLLVAAEINSCLLGLSRTSAKQ